MTQTTTRSTPRQRAISIDARVSRIMRTRGVDRDAATEIMNQELNHLRAKGHVPYIFDEPPSSFPVLETQLQVGDVITPEIDAGVTRRVQTLTGVIRPRQIPRRGSTLPEIDTLYHTLEDSFRDEEYADLLSRRATLVFILTAALMFAGYILGYRVLQGEWPTITIPL